MASKDMVGLRMSSDELARLDAEARRRGLKRAALIRNFINEGLVNPYRIIENASRGEFSSAFIAYLDYRATQIKENRGGVGFALTQLIVWLEDNPYHPKAYERVCSVLAFSCRLLPDAIRCDAARLEEIARLDSSERVYEEFLEEFESWATHNPEEDDPERDE